MKSLAAVAVLVLSSCVSNAPDSSTGLVARKRAEREQARQSSPESEGERLRIRVKALEEELESCTRRALDCEHEARRLERELDLVASRSGPTDDVSNEGVARKLSYSELGPRWQPYKDPAGLGADLLLDREPASIEEIFQAVRPLVQGRKVVNLRIWLTKEAFLMDQAGRYGKELDRGLLMNIVRQRSYPGRAYSGANRARWMQAEGSFADKFGTDVALPSDWR